MQPPTDTSDANVAFGKYRLHRVLARGGMGEVYLATLEGELGFEKKLVVKTILPELAREDRFVELFAAEAKTAVDLSHGNIVPIYELGRHDDTLYIAMGYVDGPSVAHLIDRHRERDEPIPTDVALFIVQQVLTGMAYAHTAAPGRPAVVHRDLSPRNVLIERSGQVKIVDFGIAMPANVAVQARMGSVGYIAPEQARAEAPDPRADVFSVAALLYELLTREKAFPREGVWVLPDLERIPEDLRAPLERALSVEPEQRPVDAGAFLDALSGAFARHGAPGERGLASHLEHAFPSGWETEASPSTSGPVVTPATGVSRPTQTFATRLTDVVPLEKPELPAPSRARRWPGAMALAAVAGVTAGGWFLATRAPSAPTEPATAPAPATPPPPTTRPDPPPTEPARPAIVRLTVKPSDARVTVGDRVFDGGSPYELPLPGAGSVTAKVSRDGYETQLLVLRAGEPGDRDYELRAAEPGRLTVTTKSVPWAEVYVDGKRQANTPLRNLELSAGKHRVRVMCHADVCTPARQLYKRSVTIEPGKLKTLEID